MDYVRKIDEILKESFEPDLLEVIDESELHRGHKGFQEGRQTHFKIVISHFSFLFTIWLIIFGSAFPWVFFIT